MGDGNNSNQLFTALAMELRVPLLRIAELSKVSDDPTNSQINVISQHALMLVDAYASSHADSQTQLLLEPLSSNAVLYDVAIQLQPFARQFGYDVDIDQQGKGMPVLTHRKSLVTMLSLLGASLIEADADVGDNISLRRLVLGSHRSSRGVIVGVFSKHTSVSEGALQLMRQLHGRATHAVPSMLAGGAGLAIADRLSAQMSVPLKAYRHHHLNGIGSLLVPSHQLQLV